MPHGFMKRAKRIRLNDLHAKGKCIGCAAFVDAIRARAGRWLCESCRDATKVSRRDSAKAKEKLPTVDKPNPATMFWLAKAERLRVGLLHEKGLCMTCEQPLASAALAAGYWKCEACKAQTKAKAKKAHQKKLTVERKKRRALRMAATITAAG